MTAESLESLQTQKLCPQSFGTSDGADTSTILQAINYATQKKVDVINMGLGASTACSSGWQNAIDETVTAGVTVVVAAEIQDSQGINTNSCHFLMMELLPLALLTCQNNRSIFKLL